MLLFETDDVLKRYVLQVAVGLLVEIVRETEALHREVEVEHIHLGDALAGHLLQHSILGNLEGCL